MSEISEQMLPDGISEEEYSEAMEAHVSYYLRGREAGASSAEVMETLATAKISGRRAYIRARKAGASHAEIMEAHAKGSMNTYEEARDSGSTHAEALRVEQVNSRAGTSDGGAGPFASEHTPVTRSGRATMPASARGPFVSVEALFFGLWPPPDHGSRMEQAPRPARPVRPGDAKRLP